MRYSGCGTAVGLQGREGRRKDGQGQGLGLGCPCEMSCEATEQSARGSRGQSRGQRPEAEGRTEGRHRRVRDKGKRAMSEMRTVSCSRSRHGHSPLRALGWVLGRGRRAWGLKAESFRRPLTGDDLSITRANYLVVVAAPCSQPWKILGPEYCNRGSTISSTAPRCSINN